MTRVCDAHGTEVKQGRARPLRVEEASSPEITIANIIFSAAPLEVVYHLIETSPMNGVPQTRFRVFAAWACLLAVASLFTPLAGAAWSASAMDCCTGDHCTIPEHHHRKAAAHLDCDHDNSGGLTECSMSCCQDQDRPFATAMNFVMPVLPDSSAAIHVTRADNARGSIEIPRSVLPLLPPPRITTSL
jgi:hypothetical protein